MDTAHAARCPLSARRCATFVCSAVFVATVASGADGIPTESTSRPAPVMTDAAARGPVLHPQLSERVRATLHEAIPVARQRLREYRSCRALFGRLDADGVARLDGTSYFPAGRNQERKFGRGDSHAVTEVGGSAVVLCRSFARLPARQAAIILIHEALHSAGQTEYPAFSGAPDAVEITQSILFCS